MVTLVFSLIMTRILSGYFSVHDYGTYAQIILITGTVSSLTILGMMDGINYFFCKEQETDKREKYVSTIFFLQFLVSCFASLIVLIGATPISLYFENKEVKKLIVFAALLPGLQNMISLLQIMFIAIGKARHIAIRNLIVSVLKLIAVLLACYLFDNIVIVLIFQGLTEIGQIIYFIFSLRKNNCNFNLFHFDKTLFKEIFKYCIPMAMFTIVKSLNRDCDKYVIAAFTNTETLAIYTNASKQLPFDIIMTSFCTILLPYITRYISQKEYRVTQELYKAFLELSCISTTILAVGAICVSPELMRFLYTDKYLSGLSIFIVYICIDILSVFNITLLLSAAGKTKTIMWISFGAFSANLGLNIVLYHFMGLIGPAIATLAVTILQGLIILSFSVREIRTNILSVFNAKFCIVFLAELFIVGTIIYSIKQLLLMLVPSSFLIMCVCYTLYIVPLFLCNVNRLKKNLKIINNCKVTVDI